MGRKRDAGQKAQKMEGLICKRLLVIQLNLSEQVWTLLKTININKLYI